MVARSSLAGRSACSSPDQVPADVASSNRSADSGGVSAAAWRLAVKSLSALGAGEGCRSPSWTLSASSIAFSASSVGSLDLGLFAIAVVASS